MRYIIFVLLCVNILGNDFQNVNWGMSQNQVKKLETNTLVKQQPNKLSYFDSFFAGIGEALILYYFNNNKLTKVIVSFTDDYTDKYMYVEKFATLKLLLNKKYGEPQDDVVLWKNKLFKDDVYKWGLAVSLGHLACKVVYKNNNTLITLGLINIKRNVMLLITYDDVNYLPISDKANEKRHLGDL